jgi:putative endonuclease
MHMDKKKYFIYILTNANKSVLYIGITGNLPKRIYEHKRGIDEKSFTRKYNLNELVSYEVFENPRQAIAGEKQLKKWKREWKEVLIEKTNEYWSDLSEEWGDDL